MSGVTRVPVNGSVLTWARTTAGLDLATASIRVGVKESRVREWESGDVAPTVKQLRKMADVYSRPLAALFMPTPPETEPEEPIPDFRRSGVRAEVDPSSLQKAIVRARQQQADLVEIADALGASASERFASYTFTLDASPEEMGARLRELLGISEIPAGIRARPSDFLRGLVAKAEEMGVTVIQVQSVKRGVMRGFSLAKGEFPIVALNGADWPRGKIYTLLHELVHVGLRSDGLCDLEQETEESVERVCDSVAAAALMPAAEFLRLARWLERPLTLEQVSALGNEFGASGESATLRLRELGLASWDEYFTLKPDFEAAYQQHKNDEKAHAKPGMPIYYQLKVRDLGRTFIRQVLRAYGEDVLSSRDLAAMLHVRFDKVSRLAEMVGE